MLSKIDKRLVQIEELKNDIIGMLPDGNAFLEQIKSNAMAFGSLHARSLKELRVAAIMDRFTLECFEPECDLVELTPDNWRQEVDAFNPELLFVESAWEGKNGSWYRKIAHCSDELYELTEYCHKRKIPVVFWNKEDPVYTDTFIPAARCADAVFTTDIDCIEKYKTELGHDRVYHLHFAAQPRVHNPIEKYKRKDKFCFAGAYYHRYQERCKVFDAFSDYFTDSKGLDIYDRNYMNARPEHKFPERYDPYILGRLDPSEIDVAYKGYIFGINMNSVQQSQTMFARRVFELMASNTVVVGNYSRGVKNYFGDLTICTDDAKTLKNAIEKYCVDLETVDKYRLLSLRKVLKEHLCEDRLDFIVQKVYGRSLKPTPPMVAVCAHVKNQAEAKRVCNLFDRQTYSRKQLIIVSSFPVDVPESAILFSDEEFAEKRIKDCLEAEYIAYFDAKDWYGENYLLDLALTLRYGTFSGIGKNEYYCAQGQKIARNGRGEAYHLTNNLIARRSIVELSKIPDVYGKELYGDTEWNLGNMISVDAQNYCANWTENECIDAADMTIPDQGIPMKQIESTAEAVSANYWDLNSLVIDAKQIAATKIDTKTPIEIILSGNTAVLSSNLPEGVHTYLYVSSMIDIRPLLEDGRLSVVFQGAGSLDLICACIFYDASGKKLDAQYPKLGRREILTPPENATHLKLAYRPKGTGRANLIKIELGGSAADFSCRKPFLSRSNVLILTNHYPAPDDLYRNMFVHKRVQAYKRDGHVADVMRMYPYAKDTFREFEGINVIEGHADKLDSILSNGTIDTVCVHFLDRDMWDILKNHLNSIRLIIWSHGADIQPWWRRTFNYKTEEDLIKAKADSEKRMELWNEVFNAAKSKDRFIKVVFVSNYARTLVEEDYQQSLSQISEIIPNFIDTDIFFYKEKKPEDRFHIVSLRPYTSAIYANDLTVKTICSLSHKEWFSQLEFTIIGRGAEFNTITQPLKEFSNVHLEETFLRQDEIANIYHQNGIILIPTRGDTQGVSRDEAMATGVVPVTNAVAAIPEFTDETCAILAAKEDYMGLAEGIEKLYYSPDLFQQLSRNAADRVRHQSSKEYTINKELSLIYHLKD